jgi:tetratricopeptide (TPR) repeat protein
MQRSLDELLEQITQLFNDKKYTELITLLDDKLLEKYNDAGLYAWKSRAFGKNRQFELSYKYAQLAIEINPLSAIGYFARGNAWANQKEFNKSIEDYDRALSIDDNFFEALVNRGYSYYYLKEYDEAISDFSLAISKNNKNSDFYLKRGKANYESKRFSEALKDFDHAIFLDETDSTSYNWRGCTWFANGKFQKAQKDYFKAIELDPEESAPYYNIGLIKFNQKKYSEAIEYFTASIERRTNATNAYRLRAEAHQNTGDYIEAIKDYETYLKLGKDVSDFWFKKIQTQINELRKKIDNLWYDEIDRIVDEIKQILLFENVCLTHFTSLSATKAMILDESLFRLSEGNYLNDTSEGRELFKYLVFSTVESNDKDTIAEVYVERPFIGSFVSDTKHDDLTLWRMYGKEAQAEAKGCALTINRELFIKNLESKLNPEDFEEGSDMQREQTFTFYKVAYKEKNGFKIPDSSVSQGKRLNMIMVKLKKKVDLLDRDQKIAVTKLLNDIAYLFKSGDYQYENEVRLVVQGVGFKKEILKDCSPPRVFIELINLLPVLHKITLGPKVERADEWAAAFNYQIDEVVPFKSPKVEIVISRLPFK